MSNWGRGESCRFKNPLGGVFTFTYPGINWNWHGNSFWLYACELGFSVSNQCGWGLWVSGVDMFSGIVLAVSRRYGCEWDWRATDRNSGFSSLFTIHFSGSAPSQPIRCTITRGRLESLFSFVITRFWRDDYILCYILILFPFTGVLFRDGVGTCKRLSLQS